MRVKRVLCLIVALLLLCEMGLCSVTSAEPENPVSAEETVEDKKVEEEPQADAPAKGESSGGEGSSNGEGASGGEGSSNGEGASGREGSSNGDGTTGGEGSSNGEGASGGEGSSNGEGASGGEGSSNGEGAIGGEGSSNGEGASGGEGSSNGEGASGGENTSGGESVPGETGKPSSEVTPGETGKPSSEVTPGEAGKPSGEATPGETGKPSGESTPGEAGKPSGEATPGETGKPSGEATPGETGKPSGEATPGETGKPGGEATPGETGKPGGEATPGESGKPSGEATPGEAGKPSGEATPGKATPGEATPGEATPGEAEEPNENECLISSLITLKSGTISDVDYVRQKGFTGRIGIISGTVTFVNVTVDGEPLTIDNLTEHFRVAPKGVVIFPSDEDLMLNFSAAGLAPRGTKTITVTYKGKKVNVTFPRYKSSSRAATVNTRGKITGSKVGDAVITVTYKGLAAQCLICVTEDVKSIAFKAKKYSLYEGETQTLALKVQPAKASLDGLKWSSADEEIARVDQNGSVTGLKKGTTTITAVTTGGKKASCTVKVLVPIEQIELLESTEISVKGKLQLKPVFFPENAEAKSLTWKATGKAVSISKSGLVQALKPGDATITLTTDRGVVATVQVTVTQKATTISFKSKQIKVPINGTSVLKPTFGPAGSNRWTVTFTSANTDIATVDENGVVSGHSLGKTKITAKLHNKKTATITVWVVIPVEEVRIPESAELARGKTLTLKPEYLPENATEKKVKWTSLSPKVASVTSGGVVKGLKAGTAVIRAKTDNGVIAECTVTVYNPVTQVKLNRTSLTLSLYEQKTLTATYKPKNAAHTLITWSSSNQKVATVDENGLVTGLAKGKCTITAKSENGKTAKCTVTVNEYLPKRILIQKRYWTMNPGDEGQLECTFSPANTSDKTLIYSSSAPEIVSVDENGAFICHASGDAVLTATSTRASGVKEIAKIHVVGENTKPLSGLVIGVNAGHQKTPNNTQYPIEPGSSKTSAANKSGTRGKFSRTEEYVITLQISLKLEKLLVENGAQVVMIRRSNDVKLTNIQRSTIMNNAGCDLALNLHCDGSGSPDISGISTYYRAKGNWVSESAAFARELQNGMLAATGAKNEGTHKSYNYMSLNYSTVPALMIEMGYLSSRVEDPLLNTDEYQMKLAQGLLNGIQSAFGR